MRVTYLLQAIFIAVTIVLALTTGAESKKNRKHDKKDKSQTDESGISNGHEALSAPSQDSEATVTAAVKSDPMVEPAVAPEVESPSTKSQKKHDRNREGKRNRDRDRNHGGEDVREKDRRDRKEKKKNSEKKHHKKHNREEASETTTDILDITPDVSTGKETTTTEPVQGNPLVEPDVISDAEPEPTAKLDKKNRRNHKRERMRDQAQAQDDEEGDVAHKNRKKAHKKDKTEKKRNHRKHNSVESTDETDIEVNPTPSPVADGVKLTPSGPSPLQTTQQQQPPQAEPDTPTSDKKRNKHKARQAEREMTKTDKRLQRLERKMERMGHTRKNATRITCGDHVDCARGQCCLLKRSKKVCHVVDKPEGHHCVHDCMCSQGLTCVSKRKAQKSLSKGHCRRVDVTDVDVEGATATYAGTVDTNELPE